MIGALTNHLWQSTLFVLAAGLVAAALRKNGADVRYRVWLIASLKFLVPFSILMSLGGALPRITPATPTAIATSRAPDLSVAVDRIAQPFTSDVFISPTPATPVEAATNWPAFALAGVWACGFVVVTFMRIRDWRHIRAAVRQSLPMTLAAPVPVRSSPGLLEPGMVGLFRPVLLVPAGIEAHLTPGQLNAVLAHECVTRNGATTSRRSSTWWSKRSSGSIRWCGGSGRGWSRSASARAMSTCCASAASPRPTPRASSTSASSTSSRRWRACQASAVRT